MGGCWGDLGGSWCASEDLACFLDGSWVVLGGFLRVLGRVLEGLEGCWEIRGWFRGCSCGVLGVL